MEESIEVIIGIFTLMMTWNAESMKKNYFFSLFFLPRPFFIAVRDCSGLALMNVHLHVI